MPPKGMPQPNDTQRRQAIAWIRAELTAYAKKHDGDPGASPSAASPAANTLTPFTTSPASIPNVGIDAASDSVGGEGFTSFGDVQFMQDSNLERYLAAAKIVANHAVIGVGPIEFFADPGKTGFELSAINRIKHIYETHGFRTVSGEGGRPFGLEKYGKVVLRCLALSASRGVRRGQCLTLKDLATARGDHSRVSPSTSGP